MRTLEYKSWHGCIYYGYTNGEVASNLFNLYKLYSTVLDAMNFSDSEEANSFQSDSDVVHVECEEESENAFHLGFRTDNESINESEMNTFLWFN